MKRREIIERIIKALNEANPAGRATILEEILARVPDMDLLAFDAELEFLKAAVR